MKRIFNIIFIAVILLPLTWSCSEDLMDDINKNVNDPSDVASKLILTEVMTSSAFNVTGNDFAFYASTYMEHNVGIASQMYNAEIRSGEPTSSTTYNNSWTSVYTNLYNAKIAISKCSEGGLEAGNYHNLGIAQVLSAYNLAILTDLFGDVPWNEALQPGVIYQPVLDKQEVIYDDIFKLLDNAIENLNKETTFASIGTQDLIFGGDANKWIKFAYGLKARYLMRLSFKAPNYSEVIANAEKSFSSSAEQAQYKYDGTNAYSPFYSFFTDRNYFGASQSLHDKLTDFSDPRDAKFFKVHPNAADKATIVFAPNGTPVQISNSYSISALSTKTAPTYLLSYHEVEFLKAEAYARLGDKDKAETELKKAIGAAFTKVNVGLTAAKATDYYNNSVKGRFDSNPLAEIMVQKYISFFEEEAIESYNDYRRWKAMGDNAIVLANPKTSKFPLRYAYGADDVTTNNNVKAAYGDGNYIYTENVWWAGGSR